MTCRTEKEIYFKIPRHEFFFIGIINLELTYLMFLLCGLRVCVIGMILWCVASLTDVFNTFLHLMFFGEPWIIVSSRCLETLSKSCSIAMKVSSE